jgi:hypothetical protein
MSLLENAMEACTYLVKTKALDDYGGYVNAWEDGIEFKCAITFDNSIQARTAEKQGVTSRYTVTTPRSLTLQFNDYFRRERDGKLFHVTSDGDDSYTPASASLDMRQVSAEEVSTLPA